MPPKRGRAPQSVEVHDFDVDDLYSDPPDVTREAQVQNLSRDERRLRREDIELPPSPKKKKQRVNQAASLRSDDLHNGNGAPDVEGEVIDCDPVRKPWKRKHYMTAVRRLHHSGNHS